MTANKYSAEPWLSTKEIAEHLGVTVVTVRKWIASCKIPCHRVGELWKFKATEVDEWVLSGRAAVLEKETKGGYNHA